MARRVAEERELYDDGIVVELPNPSPFATREEWLAHVDKRITPTEVDIDMAAIIRELRGPLSY